MQSNNERTALKTLVEFEAPSAVSLSLSADKRRLAYGDGDSVFIGRWKNRAPHLLNVREAEGPEITNLQFLEWSPDSRYLLMASDRVVYLVEPDKPKSAIFFPHLKEVGIGSIFWSYDSAFVIAVDLCSCATAIFGVHGEVDWLPGVRMVDKKPLIALRPDCQTLAMCAYQSDVGECLMVLRCQDWSLMWKVQSSCASISGISWFPNGRAVFVWDSAARLCVHFFHPDGSSKHTITANAATMTRDDGIQVAAASPAPASARATTLFATFGAHSQVYVYNTLIWQLVTIFDTCKFTKRADVALTPFLCWSACGRYLAFAASSSTHVSIWSKCVGDSFHFPIKDGFVTDMAWHSNKATLAVATGSPQVRLLKCPKAEMSSTSTLEIQVCEYQSTMSVNKLSWVGANPSFLVLRKSTSHVAVAWIRSI